MSDPLQTARITAQMAVDVAGTAVAGALLNHLWLARSAVSTIPTKLRRCLLAVSALQLAGLLAILLLVTAIMSDASNWSAFRSALPDVLSTEAGHTLALACCGAAPLLALALVPSILQRRSLSFTALALTALLAVLRTPLGHASADGAWTVREAIQLLHLLSIEVWGGGVLVAGLLTVPALLAESRADDALAFAQRLSRTVTIAVPVVFLSGLYNSWRGLGSSLATLPRSSWGQILIAKVTLVLVALSLGSRLRLMLRRADSCNESPQAAAQLLRKWLGIEALAMLAILLLSAWLANTAPADMG